VEGLTFSALFTFPLMLVCVHCTLRLSRDFPWILRVILSNLSSLVHANSIEFGGSDYISFQEGRMLFWSWLIFGLNTLAWSGKGLFCRELLFHTLAVGSCFFFLSFVFHNAPLNGVLKYIWNLFELIEFVLLCSEPAGSLNGAIKSSNRYI